MAQLRDAKTSELLAEGTPEEIARAAEGFVAGEVLFDDVGAVGKDGVSLFDPVAVRKRHSDDLVALESAVDATPEDHKPALRAQIKERKGRVASGKAMESVARDRMLAAHERSARRAGGR
jgi:hypothetical protein